MSRIGAALFRTSTMLSGQNLLGYLRQTQRGLNIAQEQAGTLKSVNRPSDAPDKVSSIMQLQQAGLRRGQQLLNLQDASTIINNVDQAMGDAYDIVLESTTIASSQIGVGSDAETRKNQASVINSQLEALMSIVNRHVQGVPLFGGTKRSSDQDPPFVEFQGGIRYVGATQNLQSQIGLMDPVAFNSNGVESLGAYSARITGSVNLNPKASADTYIKNVNGAQGQAVRLGAISVKVGTQSVTVDLSTADTLGDVAARITDAIEGISPGAGALTVTDHGFALTASGTDITIDNVGGGETASDLGIALTATGATVQGDDIDVRLNELTKLAALDGTFDWTGGLKITQGAKTVVADFSSCATIQDMQNVINKLDVGLILEINGDGTGLNLFSQVSGLTLTVGENAGGTTASDLGLRSLGLATRLADFNNGLGVSNPDGDDFEIHLHDGTSFKVNIDAALTVQDVLTKISAAATAAGLTVGTPGSSGTTFNVGLAPDGNGFQLEDGTSGTEEFQVVQLGTSLAATDLGIYKNAGTASTLTGDDKAAVQVGNIFTHLIQLRDALLGNDERGITLAGGSLQADLDDLARGRADVGVRAQKIEQQQNRLEDLNVMDESVLSQLQDADLTEVLTRLQQLQLQMQSTFQVGAQMMQVSFLDFLR